MCGIVGFVGKQKSKTFLIGKLKRLEYRGYDSAGICGLKGQQFEVYKSVGQIDNLGKQIEKNKKFSCAILHTRWATNGIVCEKNCHPHLSANGDWAIVHNGIIENCNELRSKLKFKPNSDTDTAVISQGLEEAKVNTIFDFIDYFKGVVGGFAIVGMNKNNSQTLFLAKRKNPLYVARSNDGDFLVASDPICFENFSRKYFYFDENEFAIIKNNKITFFDENKNEIKKTEILLSDEFENAKKSHYSTFMLKEIFEEESALLRQVETYKEKRLLEKFDKDFLKRFSTIKLIGCGTAYHACLIGAKYFQKILKIPASAEIASEFCYCTPNFVDEKSLIILVSQSGETADTLKALEIAKQNNAYTLAFTNVLYSTLAKQADSVLPICAGIEIAVASTKAYVCQISAIYMFVMNLKKQIDNDTKKYSYFVDIERVARKILQFDQNNLKRIARKIYSQNKCFFIGKDMDYISALESALKINETTYINSNSYPSGELKHGYLALIEEKTPIFVFATQDNLMTKTLNSAEEAHSRGAERILITNNKNITAENTIFINENDELLMPMLVIAPMQFLAQEICKNKHINPDKPRHLAKSVTVE